MKNLIQAFRQRYSPLNQLLILGLFFRLLAVVFSKGFGWHDDHFLIIEASQSWVDHEDYNDWLPSPDAPNREPSGHSLFYTGLHYFFFKALTAGGITDPQAKMYFIRLLHALWSLLIIIYGYKIARRYGGERAAWYAGLFLSLGWFMPFISVRNLVEFVCVPLILISTYHLGSERLSYRNIFIAGLCMGLAFSIRFQSLFITAGLGLAMIIQRRNFLQIGFFGLVCLFFIVLVQGGIDVIIWQRPFAELQGYVDYNIHNSDQYGHNIWHMYFDLILGLLIPPFSFALFAGYFSSWKKTSLLFWPVLIYLAFHTYFPNKQERFVMTILPLIMTSGTVGMLELKDRYSARIKPALLRFSKYFVISINLTLLIVLSVSYSKRHRVESMCYLDKKLNSPEFIVEDSNNWDYLMPPLYYYGRWIKVKGITQAYPASSVYHYYFSENTKREKPKYIVFWEAKNLEQRIDSVRKYWPGIRYETTIEASFIDKTLYWLNPENSNETAEIYRLQ